ncbi:hypothetical protein [Nocardioides sp.]|uniref:hypothetical protein n=1 Tax=Nocardioides sp. TaxID=35761 RepID=UPI003518A46C
MRIESDGAGAPRGALGGSDGTGLLALATEIYAALAAVPAPVGEDDVVQQHLVRSVHVTSRRVGHRVEVHLLRPDGLGLDDTCLLAADVRDAVAGLAWVADTVVVVDGGPDTAIVNAGLAADAPAERRRGLGQLVSMLVSLSPVEALPQDAGLGASFRLRAHEAAVERLVRQESALGTTFPELLGDLAPSPALDSLMRRRAALGLPDRPSSTWRVVEDLAG